MRKVFIAIVALLVVLLALRIVDTATDESGDSSETPATDDPGPNSALRTSASLPSAASSVPSRPSAAIEGVLYNSDQSGSHQIYRLNPGGSSTQLTDDPSFDSWWARPSPDGTQMLFYRTPAGVRDTDYGQTSMWIAAADGSGAFEAVPNGAQGWDLHGHGEWSPDGSQLAMFGGSRGNPQIYITDHRGQNPRQLTDDGGTNLDPSWSPDGTTIVYIGCPNAVCFEDDQEVFTIGIGIDGGERTRVTDDDMRDNDPYYSPDGSRIAFLTQTKGISAQAVAGVWDIRITGGDGGEVTTLTASDAITSLPRWTVDGSAILTHRLDYGAATGFDLISIDPDTGEYSYVLQTPANEEYPSP